MDIIRKEAWESLRKLQAAGVQVLFVDQIPGHRTGETIPFVFYDFREESLLDTRCQEDEYFKSCSAKEVLNSLKQQNQELELSVKGRKTGLLKARLERKSYMRLGISTSLTHASPKNWAKKMKELGCQCVVFPVDSQAPADIIDAYCEEAKINDLMIAEVGIWRNAISEDPIEARTAMDYSIRQLQLADTIQARCCVNIAGAAGERWDGAYQGNFSQRTWNRTVRMIQEVIDEVKPRHTYFTIEPMPWMYPTGPEEYAKLLEEVNREQFGVHMDIINMINTPQRYFFPDLFVEQCFELLGPAIKSCHVKDIRLEPEFTFRLKECACGEGNFCLEKYVELANQTDSEMPMIIEHLDTDEAYMNSIRYVKKRLKMSQ